MEYEIHPFAEIFPLPSEDSTEFQNRCDSLKSLGMITPIVLYQGKILDGRTRYRAYLKYPDQIELKTEEFVGTDREALQRSLALNNERRDMNTSKRALAAWRYARFQVNLENMSARESDEVATKVFRIGITNVKLVGKIMNSKHNKEDREVLISNIEQGLSVALAHSIMENLPPKMWDQACLDGFESENGNGKPGTLARKWIKQAKRQQKEIEFANGTVAANRQLTEDTMVYGVIYIDPPWPFETYSEAGKDRSPDNHYPTMSLDDIRAMKIPAADDCVMFMWTTVAHLANAVEILQGWGFEYKSAYVWHKTVAGLGYWSPNTVELLLLGTKGTVPAPLPEQRMNQVIVAAQGKHSEKPEAFADGITKMFPHVAKIDMFARKRNHKGENWFYHGNEVVDDESSPQVSTRKVSRKKTNGKRNGHKPAPGATKEEESQEESISP